MSQPRGAQVRAIEVFADVACPFAHVGLHRFRSFQAQQGQPGPRLRVRAWPLELINAAPFDGQELAPRIEALRAGVAPDLFTEFAPERFPTTSLPSMVSEAAAYRTGPECGERFSLAVRQALFEEGVDVSSGVALRRLRNEHGVLDPIAADEDAVGADLAEGRSRGVAGSPHFFSDQGDFFCPSLEIVRVPGGLHVEFDVDGFQQFVIAVFGTG